MRSPLVMPRSGQNGFLRLVSLTVFPSTSISRSTASVGSWKERRRFERGARDGSELDGLYRERPVPRFGTVALVAGISEASLCPPDYRETFRIPRSLGT